MHPDLDPTRCLGSLLPLISVEVSSLNTLEDLGPSTSSVIWLLFQKMLAFE